MAELVSRGAASVVAGMRDPGKAPVWEVDDGRVHVARLDITDDESVLSVAGDHDIDLLINNAGIWGPIGLLAAPDLTTARLEMETNFFGTLRMCRAFVPTLRRSQGCIVNVLSIGALASVPLAGSYAASKAAALSLTQALRAELADDGVCVHAVIAGKIASDMARGREQSAAPPADVATAILDGVEQGDFMIYPDPQSQHIRQLAEAGGDALLDYLGAKR